MKVERPGYCGESRRGTTSPPRGEEVGFDSHPRNRASAEEISRQGTCVVKEVRCDSAGEGNLPATRRDFGAYFPGGSPGTLGPIRFRRAE